MIVIYDFEVYQNLLGVVARNNKNGKDIVFEISERRNDLDGMKALFSKPYWFVGFNNKNYDDIIAKVILRDYKYLKTLHPLEICKYFYNLSHLLIKGSYSDIKKYKYIKSSLRSIDLFKVARQGFHTRGLKLIGVNLEHPNISDLPYPFDKILTNNEVQDVLDYCVNDVDTTQLIFNFLRDEGVFKLRTDIIKKYKVSSRVMTESKSGIARILLEKMYADASEDPYKEFTTLRTHRPIINLKDIIADNVKFIHPPLKELHERMLNTSITTGEDYRDQVNLNGSIYDLAKGGLHSLHGKSRFKGNKKTGTIEIYEKNNDYVLIDADVSSYYPYLMVILNLYPAHLKELFIELLHNIIKTRIKAKREKDWITSDALKITVNSVYGRTGFEGSWLYDPKVLYSVTINGELYLLMLIDWLERVGINVFYANTDGITSRVRKDQVATFYKVCAEWEAYTKLQLEYMEFDRFIIKNVNNYIVRKTDGSVKVKGQYNENLHKEDLMKAFKYPIVPKAVRLFVEKGTPIEKTIKTCKDPLQFCMAQKVNTSTFKVEMHKLNTENSAIDIIPCLNVNRYLACKPGYGGILKKINKETKKPTSLVSGQNVLIVNSIEQIKKRFGTNVPIDYTYYIREAMKLCGDFSSKQESLLLGD